jgi:hypothetical protein
MKGFSGHQGKVADLGKLLPGNVFLAPGLRTEKDKSEKPVESSHEWFPDVECEVQGYAFFAKKP